MLHDCTDRFLQVIRDFELDDFGLAESGTDKISRHSYESVYGKYLARYVNRKGNLLEIGVCRGGSSVLWQELLPKFNLCIVDNEDNLNPKNSARLDPAKVNYIITDAYTEEFRNSVKEAYPDGFDFITDDGPHTLESQIKCVELYVSLLTKDGVMIIEDIDPNNVEAMKNYLNSYLPKGYAYEMIDLRHIKNRFDDIVVVIGKKSVINKKSKIVMMTMFKNESSVIKNMLESCAPYIDYWVIQNNGSTDGTDKIVKEFFDKTGIPGVLYDVSEGWVGFGWNRDHLIRKCQSIDHGCDWILKMDCDETLEVDDEFDWSLFDNTETHSFHVPCSVGHSLYYRAWMYNAKLPWRFNHDPCHETVYCELSEIGESYTCFNLPKSFRHMGSLNKGQSWTVPTKFMSDALILEERLLREGTMLSNMYHFWYIGKSYNDCYRSPYFPLKENQQKEYARRCIFYFEEYVNHIYNVRTGSKTFNIDEMSYMAMIFTAEAYKFLGENGAAVATYHLAENFAPDRNDHIMGLAQHYQELGDYDNMLVQTTRMMQPERTNVFPRYSGFIDTSLYHDSNTGKVQTLHQEALNRVQVKKRNSEPAPQVTPPPAATVEEPKHKELPFHINVIPSKKLFVVDNFYSNPDEIRNFALNNVTYKEDLRWYKGLRSEQTYIAPGTKQAFESILGESISFDGHGFNGVFQITRSSDPQVYHFDIQKWAAMIYLTPDAPLQSGTRTHMSKINGTKHSSDPNVDDAFKGDFFDSTKFELVDNAANIYNRLVIMDARSIHSAGPYFGQTPETGRLIHLFFFD